MASVLTRLKPFKSARLRSWQFHLAGADWRPADDFQTSQSSKTETGFPSSVVRSGHKVVMAFDNLAQFEIDTEKHCVTLFDVKSDVTDATISHLLDDHVAPRILAGEGMLVLHGSAVAIDGNLAVFLGDTGAGKSTVAASLSAARHTLLGDDAVVVSRSANAFMGESVYPSLRLFPEAAEAVLGSEIETSPMAHYSAKRQVELPASETAAVDTFPIKALFFLTGDWTEEGASAVSLTPGEVCIALIEQSFSFDPNDAQAAAERMRMASHLAQDVPGYELSYPEDLDRLDEVNAMILDCMKDPDNHR